MRSVRRELAHRPQVRADLAARERTESGRVDVGTRCRQADFGQGLSACGGEHRCAEQAADAALVGRHAMRRIALGVFDVGVALAMRLPYVLDGDIVLQIDERLATARHLPQRLQRRGLGVGGRGVGRRCARPGTGIRRARGSERNSDACRRSLAVTRGGSEPERARDRASGRAEPVGQHRGERGEILAPLQRAARLRGERGLRLVAAGEQHAVGLDGRQGLAIAAGDLHGAHLATALDGRDHRAMMHGDADRDCACGGSRCGPRVDDGRDAHARLVQREHALVGPVVVGEEHRSLRDRDTIAA